MKNVISTSLYGGDKRYFQGALYNSKLAKKYFPDWEFRVYHENGLSQDFLKQLRDEEVKTIDIGQTHVVGSLWRFLVYDDEDVNYFICRDLDDRLNNHDAELVKAWMETEYPFQIIRSHRGHRTEILAGMWGGKSKYIPGFNMKNEMDSFSYESRNKDEDQKFLRLILYPKIRDISVVYGYDFFDSPVVKNFPIEFYAEDGHITYPVGEVYESNDEKSKYE